MRNELWIDQVLVYLFLFINVIYSCFRYRKNEKEEEKKRTAGLGDEFCFLGSDVCLDHQ